jgi:A/G-specific adenine glycosylase
MAESPENRRKQRLSAAIPSRAEFRAALLSWYDAEARRLPWRRIMNSYSVWVSEVMLQQTRAEVVATRFEAFLRTFPDAARLAAAPEETVLAHWSGLGYYSRARNLRQGAAVVAEEHGGRFPRSLDAALSIPGVGRYTAAAVLSIAYGLPHAVVDGNVRRVLTRLERLEPPQDRKPAELDRLAHELLNPERPGDHNQAMMELGAVLCLPRDPRCSRCPVTGFCRVYLEGEVGTYPRPAPRAKPTARRFTLCLLRDAKGRLLLEKGRWMLMPQLWLPPLLEDDDRSTSMAREFAAGRPVRVGRALRRTTLREIGLFRHAITRYRLDLRVVTGRINPGRGRMPAGFRLIGAEELRQIGRSSLLEKALRLEAQALGAPVAATPSGPS